MADIVITAANVLKSSAGQTTVGTTAAATTITAGQALYLLANGTIGLADADGASPTNSVVGIALHGSTAGQPIVYLTSDTSFTFGGTVLAGDTIWLADTAGGITKTFSDLETGDKVIVLGVALTTTTMILSPVTGGTI